MKTLVYKEGVIKPVTAERLQPHLDAGWKNYFIDSLGRWQKHEPVETATHYTLTAVDDPNITITEKRDQLSQQVAEHAKTLESTLTGKYPPGEISRWQEYKTAITAQDWAAFEPMVPVVNRLPVMTGQEYAESVIAPKIQPWTDFSNALIKARNTHEFNIENTPESQLSNYDITAGWPV